MSVLICNLLIPIIVLIIGRIMWKHYPKNINGLVGYRTTRSMKNKDTWKFANEYCGRLWYKLGLIMLVFSMLIFMLFYRADDNTISMVSLILMVVQCIILIATIFSTESVLKKTFFEDGVQR